MDAGEIMFAGVMGGAAIVAWIYNDDRLASYYKDDISLIEQGKFGPLSFFARRRTFKAYDTSM